MSRGLRFVHRGVSVEIDAFSPMTTVLEWLRVTRGLTGTKEGCNEGDCGACTVSIGRVENGVLVRRPANACILLLGQLDGCEVITVDDLADGGALHPVQQAMVDHHGSQCGFCTPGIVMSLFTLQQDGGIEDGGREAVLTRLAGNLCRCTGYRPIIDAALDGCRPDPNDRFRRNADTVTRQLLELDDDRDLWVGNDTTFFAAPASLDALCALCAAHPDAVILGGATDVGLWINKQMRELPKIIHTGRVKALREIRDEATRIEIGAAATYAQAEAALAALDPDVALWLDRLGSAQVRTSGTIGGNIANGSPIGDSPPLLIALGSTITLRHARTSRTLPLENFFIRYGKQDRAPGEVLTGLTVEKPGPDDHVRVYKISKRLDQDISSVLCAMRLTVKERRITAARIAFGGMAGIPKRAEGTERALIGISIDEPGAVEAAVDVLTGDFAPLDDHRASARYRMTVARNLIRKGILEIATGDRTVTRIGPLREARHAA